MSTTVVGVDGWRGRWVAAEVDRRDLVWRVHDSFATVLASYPRSTIAVDMPIGLVDGRRASDKAAQQFLRDRGAPPSSIFLTPDITAVAAFEAKRTHTEAMSDRPPGTRVSIQAWNLIAAMVDVRDALADHGRTDIHEAHPECSFRLLGEQAGIELGAASKKTGLGVGLRLRALRSAFDLDLADAPPGVATDDLLDAAALAWTAARIDRGSAMSLPPGATAAPRILV